MVLSDLSKLAKEARFQPNKAFHPPHFHKGTERLMELKNEKSSGWGMKEMNVQKD